MLQFKIEERQVPSEVYNTCPNKSRFHYLCIEGGQKDVSLLEGTKLKKKL